MKKVLIIDDNKDLGEVIQGYLEDKYDVTYVAQGRTGLNMLITNDYDYLLLDLVMPDCDGAEILNNIRQLTKKPKVIVISGHSMWSKMSISLGATKFLEKPFQKKDLLELLD